MRRFYGSLINKGKIIMGIWFTEGVNLTFNRRSMWYTILFGLLAEAFTIGKFVLTVPISQIYKIEFFKFRLNKKAIRLYTESGTIELVSNKAIKLYNLINDNMQRDGKGYEK